MKNVWEKMPNMTHGKRRIQAKERAKKKFKRSLDRDMTEEEKVVFQAAFGMGWKEGKKRQRQLTREELKEKK